ncbi:hypothetical protein [Streptomyces sp. NPDC127084]|uniref:hypothetical protein n=1 Tax=Streptomyces sp. NPDC127084 TaxID=3347133 RepID=UPI00364B74C2
MKQRDTLRARLATAPPEAREQIRAAIQLLWRAAADALADVDITAEALNATAPRPAPGPRSPEAEQGIRDQYERLIAEQRRDEEN